MNKRRRDGFGTREFVRVPVVDRVGSHQKRQQAMIPRAQLLVRQFLDLGPRAVNHRNAQRLDNFLLNARAS